MKIYSYILLTICFLFIKTTMAEENDFSQINNVINLYFDGTSQAKPELIRKAFLPSLELQAVHEGELVRRKGDKYIKYFENAKPNDRVGRLISVDISNDAAVAKAEVTFGGKIYIDYFLLLKLKTGWKIANKTYTRLK